MGMIFTLQSAVGSLGSSSVLLHCLTPEMTKNSLMLIILTVKHLTSADCLCFLSRGIPKVMTDFGMKYFPDGIGYKLVLYLSLMLQGISLYATPSNHNQS